ncbi:uncharacterized protein G2W53_016572 [Senna tora]|uniref:Uncharacterized protein n=1 Tax=Senna tora TaxID=362788 RepID=A0A834WLN2_9FABA|nr:uncharacterized protein G2W53_016572 [Senna tora]
MEINLGFSRATMWRVGHQGCGSPNAGFGSAGLAQGKWYLGVYEVQVTSLRLRQWITRSHVASHLNYISLAATHKSLYVEGPYCPRLA